MNRFSILILILVSIFLVACPKEPVQVPQPVPTQASAPSPAPEPIVAPGVTLVSVPTSVKEGEEFQISWRVNAKPNTVISHTAVHYDVVSRPGTFGFDILPPQAGYKELTLEHAAGEFVLPSTFTSKIKTPTGVSKIYFRAHAIILGENYWTAEQTIDVTKSMQQTSGANSYIIQASDGQAKPSSLTVPKGSKFKITFNVDSEKVYYGGLDFRSTKFTSPKVRPGGSWTTPELTADATFKISAYWPASNVKKWDLTVNVG